MPTVTELGTAYAGFMTSLTITTTADIAAGDLIVVFCSSTNNADAASSVTDSGGVNTYTALTAATGHCSAVIFYCANAAALATGSTITITYPVDWTHRASAITVSGMATSSPLDTQATATGSFVTGVSTSTGTLSQASELVVGCFQTPGTQTLTESSGFTSLTAVRPDAAPLFPAFQIVSATTSVTYAPTISSTSSDLAQCEASFLAQVVADTLMAQAVF